MFVDREKELSILENEYKKDEFRFLVLYGRRVGKTTLICLLDEKAIDVF